jgi:hypothetical protein
MSRLNVATILIDSAERAFDLLLAVSSRIGERPSRLCLLWMQSTLRPQILACEVRLVCGKDPSNVNGSLALDKTNHL